MTKHASGRTTPMGCPHGSQKRKSSKGQKNSISQEKTKLSSCINNPKVLDQRSHGPENPSLRAFMNGLESEKHRQFEERRPAHSRNASFCNYDDIGLPPRADPTAARDHLYPTSSINTSLQSTPMNGTRAIPTTSAAHKHSKTHIHLIDPVILNNSQ